MKIERTISAERLEGDPSHKVESFAQSDTPYILHLDTLHTPSSHILMSESFLSENGLKVTDSPFYITITVSPRTIETCIPPLGETIRRPPNGNLDVTPELVRQFVHEHEVKLPDPRNPSSDLTERPELSYRQIMSIESELRDGDFGFGLEKRVHTNWDLQTEPTQKIEHVTYSLHLVEISKNRNLIPSHVKLKLTKNEYADLEKFPANTVIHIESIRPYDS